MGLNVTQKLIASHLVVGEAVPGTPASVRITQTLAHDLTGPVVLAQLEQMGVGQTSCDPSVFYVDHDLSPTAPEAVERQMFMRAAASRVGALYSRPGNGIAHQVHLERFGVPGRTLLGADPHSQILGALGMLALSGQAVEVTAAMAGEPHDILVPAVLRVVLRGKLRPFVSPKDIALELLRRRGPGALAGMAVEIDGPGARALGVYERATIASFGPLLGAVFTVFPSDEKTKIFLQRQRRSKSWRRIEADPDAEFQGFEEIDLGAVEPLAFAGPPPGEVRPVREIQGLPVREVLIGSCTNSSARDILTIAAILRGKKVHPACTCAVSPGSRQTLELLAREGSSDGGKALADLVSSGVRILESGCGPCASHGWLSGQTVSVRTFAHVECGASEARVVVVSPETAAACAVFGELVDPRKLRRPPKIKLPRQLPVDDSMILKPGRSAEVGGAAVAPEPPELTPPSELEDALQAKIVQRLGHRARLESVSPFDLETKPSGRRRPTAGCLVAGRLLDYGARGPEVVTGHRRSGLRVVIAEGFSPSCEVGLANAGVVPLRFVEAADYERVKPGDELVIRGLVKQARRDKPIRVSVAGNGVEFDVACRIGERGRQVLAAGGLLGFLTRGRTVGSRARR